MDLSERIEKLAADIARLGIDSEAHSRVAASLTSQLEFIRVKVDGHEGDIVELKSKVEMVHAVTREIRDNQDEFSKSAARHVKRLHGEMAGQREIMQDVAGNIATAIEESRAHTQALATMSQAKKVFALAPTLIGLGLFLAGLLAGLFR